MAETPGLSGAISDMEPNDFGVRCDVITPLRPVCHLDRSEVGAPPVISSGANEVSGVEKSLTAEIPPLRRFAPTVGMTMGGPCGRFNRKWYKKREKLR